METRTILALRRPTWGGLALAGLSAALSVAGAFALTSQREPQAASAPSGSDIILAAESPAPQPTVATITKPAATRIRVVAAPERPRRPQNEVRPTAATNDSDRSVRRSAAIVSARMRPPPVFELNSAPVEPKTAVAYRAAAPVALPPPPPPPAVSVVAAAPIVHDETAVRSLLERYRGAYERLDAGAAKMIWPSVDERRLARAFSDLDAQSMTFDNCRIDVDKVRGVASCRGRTDYVARIGNKSVRTQTRMWTFQLRKNDDRWTIDSVRSHGQGTNE